MARSQLPFLDADECRKVGIPVVPHTVHINGEDVPCEIGKPSPGQELQFCRDDDDTMGKLIFDSAKLVLNAFVRGPAAKEAARKKQIAERLFHRRSNTLLWASVHDRVEFDAHYGNGRDAYADAVFAQHRDAVCSAFPGTPA